MRRGGGGKTMVIETQSYKGKLLNITYQKVIKKLVISTFSLITVIISLSGCTPSIYMVSVVDSSPKEEPLWLTQHLDNEIVGFGEHKYKKIAYGEAIKDLQQRIASEIGIELEFHSTDEKHESKDGFYETTKLDLDIIGDAILQEIHTSISGTYWEHCRAQTSRKSFNDFYRYYVKANISPEMINTLRTLTVTENNKRLELFNESLSRADSLMQEDNASHPVDLLREYIEILDIANSLFYEKKVNSRTCLNRINKIVNDFRINLLTSYSEVRPIRHYLEFKVDYKYEPVKDIKVEFHLSRGDGSINQYGYTDNKGVVRCNVDRIWMNRSNKIIAYLDLSDPLDHLNKMNSPILELSAKNLKRVLNGRACPANFSSQSQKANVRGGSLEIRGVTLARKGFYRRVKDMECKFYLEEINGRSVEFRHFDVLVRCWYQPPLSNKWYTDQREGNYGISPIINLKYNEHKDFTLSNSNQIAGIINELKSAHEIGMRQIQIFLTLHGKDDAGNNLKVNLETDKIPWLNLFEK